MISPFDLPQSQAMVQDKLDHLEWLSTVIDLSGRILEPGCGLCDLTNFFVTRDNEVVSTDGREGNVEEARWRNPLYDVRVADLERPGDHLGFGTFDVVFLYGALYHLKNPALALEELASVCGRLMLISTCVHHEDNDKLNRIGERKASQDQALHGFGCRPGRDWVWNCLSELFEFVYMPLFVPRHVDYRLDWPHLRGGLSRTIFVASREEIDIPDVLCPFLPQRQERIDARYTL